MREEEVCKFFKLLFNFSKESFSKFGLAKNKRK
jgi:hypothetical protein